MCCVSWCIDIFPAFLLQYIKCTVTSESISFSQVYHSYQLNTQFSKLYIRINLLIGLFFPSKRKIITLIPHFSLIGKILRLDEPKQKQKQCTKF